MTAPPSVIRDTAMLLLIRVTGANVLRSQYTTGEY